MKFLPTDDVLRVTTCHLCNTCLPEPALDLGLQPLCDDLVVIGDGREARTYPVNISMCPTCLTAHQLFNVRKEILFPSSYHYRARFTQDVLDGMRDLVDESTFRAAGLRGKLVCDVGCNDGSLLGFFRAKGARTAGIEPTEAAAEASEAGHLIIQDYFSPASAHALVAAVGRPDIVTFTNVFAHVESVEVAIAALKVLLKPTTLVVIENHYLGTVLESGQFDTFYHEHPRTYSLSSFAFISNMLGGEIVDVTFPRRYGGNIRVVIGRFDGPDANSRTPPAFQHLRDESAFPGELARMQRLVDDWAAITRRHLDELIASGMNLCGKSFPGRASILINLLRIDADRHPVVYEKPGSMKIGHYVPGTRIQISTDEMWMSGQDQPDGMIIWGWHIAAEIASYVRARGFRGRLYQPLPSFQPL